MYKKIMVPLDGSELAECALPHVEAITTGCKITNVVFVRVLQPIQLPARLPAQGEFGFQEKDRREIDEQRKKTAEAYLEKIVQKTALGDAVHRYEVLEGNVAETLASWAEQNGAFGSQSLGDGQRGRPAPAFRLRSHYDDPGSRLRTRYMITSRGMSHKKVTKVLRKMVSGFSVQVSGKYRGQSTENR
jgi:nucleotide-binding universal stress UspA family protein